MSGTAGLGSELPSQGGNARRGMRAAWVLLVAAGIAAAFVYTARVSSWSHCWRWSITEGREGQTIYAIWRVVHGAPLYEWPNSEPYAITYLNYGFYFVYGALSRAFSADGEALLWVPRVITALGSVAGTALFVSTGKLIARPRTRLEWLGLGALAFTVWFGTQFIAWWAISIRPDVWAAVFALAGLRLALPALATGSLARLAAASLFFYFAWSFKQSCILSFVGCALSAVLVTRSWRALVALAAPFALLATTSLFVGGEVYRLSIISIPAASRLELGLLVEVLSRALPQNLWVFGFFPLVLAVGFLRGRTSFWTALPLMIRALAVVAFVGVLLGTVALGREGSNKNHLFEGYIASALASYWALHRSELHKDVPGWVSVLGTALLVPFVLFPIAQIAMPNRVGRTVLCSSGDGAEFAKLAAAFARLPKPVFTEDEVFSLPWHSTDGRYPAVVIDGTLYGIAKREGFVRHDFPSRLLRVPRFRAVVQVDGHPTLAAVRARGASCHDLPGQPFGFQYVACLLSPAPP
jgi:hypothetical protein